jgi:adenylate kinase family enzyme
MVKRIAVVGNAGAGKTTLSRSLARIHQLPLTHVDSIQFLAGMQIRPHKESIAILNEIQDRQEWIIEGYGPLDIIEKRFQMADRVIFIDFPIWRHFWWCTKRQVKNAWSKREELPEGCDEFSYVQTAKLFRSVWKIHQQMRPQLLKIFARESLKNKMTFIRTYSEWKKVFSEGIPS